MSRAAVAAGLAAALTAAALLAIPAAARQAKRPRGPFVTAAMRTFLATRVGNVTAAVYNVKTGRLFLYRPGVQEDEASIAKVDILATLLHDAAQQGLGLSSGQQQLATAAIEESDNDAAQQLWDEAGYNQAIATFDAEIGMTQTILDAPGVWGHYETTALDQVRLLEHLVLANPLLDPASRAYELGLMRNVTSAQAWGVSAGVLAPARVALKNGWLAPANEVGWQVNSIGAVNGRFRDYLIAVLTSDDPSMPYGVQTIDGISALVWKHFLPRRFRRHAAAATAVQS